VKRAFVLTALVLASAGNARAELLTKVPVPSNVAGGCALTPLADGRALITGGSDATTKMTTSTAEVFDPASKTWSAVTRMSIARDGHAAVRLPSGSVLVMGGNALSGTLSSSELYDPATGAWTTVGSVSRGTLSPMTVLSDGRAATIVADRFATTFPSFELFNPTTRTWSYSEAPTLLHKEPALAPLSAGGLLVMSQAGVERFEAGEWTELPPMAVRRLPGMLTLKDGRVLVVGGGTSSAGGLPLVFSPETGSFRTLSGQRRGPGASATELRDGRVLLAGGQAIFAGETLAVEVFDPATLNVAKLLEPPNNLYNHVAVPLGDGVLIVDRGNRDAYLITPPKACTAGADCASGHCADGVCCDAACTGQCEACDTTFAIGKCVGVAGAPRGARKECSPAFTPACRALSCDPTRSRTECVAPVFKPPCDCTRDEECESGHCADGVCCNVACDGQCEACDLPSARGVCTPVVGEPRGVRKGCDPPGRGICSIQACNGVETKECVYTKGAETLCDSICGGQVQRHCNGGVCGLPSELRCPDESCSIRAVEPAVARWSDAVWVVIAAALANRLRRRR